MFSIAINLLIKIEDHIFGLHNLRDSGYPRLLYLQYVNICIIIGRKRVHVFHLFVPLSVKNKFSVFIKACWTSLFWLILGKNDSQQVMQKKENNREPKARFKRRTFHEPNLIRIKADPNYLDRLN